MQLPRRSRELDRELQRDRLRRRHRHRQPARHVTVANVAPTVTLSGADSADEGTTQTYNYSATDPGDDSPLVWTLDCGAEGTRSNTTATSFDCSFPDGPESSTVSASAFDGSDTAATRSR